MTALRQRFVSHVRLGRGGYYVSYQILDGDRVVGTKTVGRESRSDPETTVYTLGELEFGSAQDFVAACRRANERRSRDPAL